MNGHGETIENVIATYDQWKKNKDEADAHSRRRQVALSQQIRLVLGEERFGVFKDLSSDLQRKSKESYPIVDSAVDDYVHRALHLFRSSALQQNGFQETMTSEALSDSMSQVDEYFRTGNAASLELFSNLAACIPDEVLREKVLHCIEAELDKLESHPLRLAREDKRETPPSSVGASLPEIKESELSEKFIKGSGAGGQKVNKTSNKVILIHQPTKIRVECQDTRSLQQSRKIARKRLQLKLDEYYNGSMSITQQKVAAVAMKKAKAFTRNKQRRRMKKESNEQVDAASEQS